MLATLSQSSIQVVLARLHPSASRMIVVRFVSVTNRASHVTSTMTALREHTATTQKSGLSNRSASPIAKTKRSALRTSSARSPTTAGSDRKKTKPRIPKSALRCTQHPLAQSLAGMVAKNWAITLKMASFVKVVLRTRSELQTKQSVQKPTESPSMVTNQKTQLMSRMIALRRTLTKSALSTLTQMEIVTLRANLTSSVAALLTPWAQTRDSAKVSLVLTSMQRPSAPKSSSMNSLSATLWIEKTCARTETHAVLAAGQMNGNSL